MQAALSYKIDAFLTPVKVFYKTKQDNTVKEIMGKIKAIVGEYLASGQPIEVFANGILSRLFDLRIVTLNWLIDNRDSLEDISASIAQEMEEWGEDPTHTVLYENLLFATRINGRVVNSLIGNYDGKELDLSEIKKIPHVSYEGFLNLISRTLPDAVFPVYVDFLNASLNLELGVISTYLIYYEKINPSTLKLNELAAFLAEYGQEFGAIAIELDASPKRETNNFFPDFISEEALEENRLLAELGIQELSVNI